MAAKNDKNPRRQLCDLPDELLIRILSLHPTKSAVATSVVSKRWRHLWASVTNLDFTERLMFPNQRNRFIDFVDRAMFHRGGSHLVTFSLDCGIHGDATRINAWITCAIQCNVEELSLVLLDSELPLDYSLPCSIFESSSLVKLTLAMPPGYIHTTTTPCGLTCLKYLKLGWIKFVDSESAEKLLSCPLIQELHLMWCNWEDIDYVTVYAPTLQTLEIVDSGDAGYDDAVISIVGENMKSFKYSGILNNEYRIRASPVNLMDVEINLSEDVLDYEDVASKRCYQILSGFSGVQSLTLNEYFLECLEREEELINTIPVFERVTELNLEDPSEKICMDKVVIMKIFERCPHLELLNIMEPFSTSSQLNPTPSCFFTHLKRVGFYRYFPDNEDCAVNMFLSNAAVLEEMEIYCRFDACNDHPNRFSGNGHTIEEYRQELNRRPKISEDCIISASIEITCDVWNFGRMR